jgi:hypothetical protein
MTHNYFATPLAALAGPGGGVDRPCAGPQQEGKNGAAGSGDVAAC